MKFPLWVLASMATAALFAGGEGEPPVTYINHEKVNEALAKNGSLVRASDLIVLGAHRAGAGESELHEKETDVFYIVDGSATFITGGKMVGGKVTAPGQVRGTGIEGGDVHPLTRGDVIVIPAGVPHWFKEVQSISYTVVKVLKP